MEIHPECFSPVVWYNWRGSPVLKLVVCGNNVVYKKIVDWWSVFWEHPSAFYCKLGQFLCMEIGHERPVKFLRSVWLCHCQYTWVILESKGHGWCQEILFRWFHKLHNDHKEKELLSNWSRKVLVVWIQKYVTILGNLKLV